MVTRMAFSFNVPDPRASADFLMRHLGFSDDMEQGDDFVSLSHPVGGANVIFLRTGLATFKPAHRAGAAGEGTLLVYDVDRGDRTRNRTRG